MVDAVRKYVAIIWRIIFNYPNEIESPIYHFDYEYVLWEQFWPMRWENDLRFDTQYL